MSYILDALRRSEAERKQGQVPDLVAPLHMIPARRASQARWPWIVGGGLLLNAGVLAVIFWPDAPHTMAPATPPSTPAPAVQAAPVVIPEAPPVDLPVVAVTAPVVEPQAQPVVPVPAPVSPAPVSTPPPIPNEPVFQTIAALPLDMQRRIPDLRFNSHIYSSMASARRVMINSILLREGDRFSGMQLLEITPEGIVLSLDGLPFTVDASMDWSAPR